MATSGTRNRTAGQHVAAAVAGAWRFVADSEAVGAFGKGPTDRVSMYGQQSVLDPNDPTQTLTLGRGQYLWNKTKRVSKTVPANMRSQYQNPLWMPQGVQTGSAPLYYGWKATAAMLGAPVQMVRSTANYSGRKLASGAGRVRYGATRKNMVLPNGNTPDICDFNLALERLGVPKPPDDVNSLTREQLKTEMNLHFAAYAQPKATFLQGLASAVTPRDRNVIASQLSQADRHFAYYMREGKFPDGFDPTDLSDGMRKALVARFDYAATKGMKRIQKVIATANDRALTHQTLTNDQIDFTVQIARMFKGKYKDLAKVSLDLQMPDRWEANHGTPATPDLDDIYDNWTQRSARGKTSATVDGTPKVDQRAIERRMNALNAIPVLGDDPAFAQECFDQAWRGYRCKIALEQSKARGEITDDRAFNQELMKLNRFIDGQTEMAFRYLPATHLGRAQLSDPTFIDDQVKRSQDEYDVVRNSGRTLDEFRMDVAFGGDATLPVVSAEERFNGAASRSVSDRVNTILTIRGRHWNDPSVAGELQAVRQVQEEIRDVMKDALMREMDNGGAWTFDDSIPGDPRMVVAGLRPTRAEHMKLMHNVAKLETWASHPINVLEASEVAQLRDNIENFIDNQPRVLGFATGQAPPAMSSTLGQPPPMPAPLFGP
jgi:hypothetical protein